MKKSTANELAKECIYTALLQLMEQNAYSDITVTDIAKRAGVSRMTYYRNYRSKDDIFIQHIDGLFCSFETHIVPGCIEWNGLWSLFFQYFHQNQLITAVIKAELTESVFQCFSRHIHHICQDLLLWDMADYHNVLLVNYQIGALLGLLRHLHLSAGGHTVSDEQAAEFQTEASSLLQQLAHLN
ncbi:MAG: TetR/AcrR family transcriptional regulator [Lachnospiraceae bacterium]|nr:TetR/AcrR family transcriptional regulator [Lachnospiraceae bacterium]